MLSLWALFLLSAMVIAWALDINTQITNTGSANRALEATAMASSGVEVALCPTVHPGSPVLKHRNGTTSYEAQITGENGRINLNWITLGENQDKLAILDRYLAIKGIEMNERSRMIDNLLDYVEPNNGIHHLNSDPETDDYHPKHAQLQQLDEVKQIKGWEEFTAREDWDADFTLVPTRGISLASASRDVLLSLPDMTEERVDQFLTLRRGPDGLEGTEDDAQFGSPAEALAALGYNTQQPEAQSQLAALFIVKDFIFRIVSTGHSGNVSRVIQTVVNKASGGATPPVLSWKEL
jgi:hypothetical protein